MNTYRVIQISPNEWGIEYTPHGHPPSTIKGDYKTEAEAQEEMDNLIAVEQREAELP